VAQFRTTADLVDAILNRAGEPTNGNSSYESDALTYANKVHKTVIAGGTIFDYEIDETWKWAKSRTPMVIELMPAYETGSITLTNGDEAGTFSAAPSISLKGYHLQVGTDREVYKIISHSASSADFELDSNYQGTSGSGKTYKAIKLDYELSPTHLYVTARNNKLDFFDVAAQTQLTATLTAGSYTPSELATHVAAALTTPSVATWSGSYDSDTRKFTFTSDLSGGATRQGWLGVGTNSSQSSLALLGFDQENTAATNTTALTSTYITGGISRLVEPFRIYKGDRWDASVIGIDDLTMSNQYPITTVSQGFPDRFTKLHEDADGNITVRFNKYVKDQTKIEIEYVPVPRDLKDNAASAPFIPRKYADLLEYGGAYFILLDKEDTKKDEYAKLAIQQLKAMQRHNRSEQARIGKYFGDIVSREDKVHRFKQHGRRTYGYDSGE